MPGMEVSVFGIISNCCSMALSSTLTCSFSARMEAIDTDIAWFTELFTVTGRRCKKLKSFCYWVSEVPALFINEGFQTAKIIHNCSMSAMVVALVF